MARTTTQTTRPTSGPPEPAPARVTAVPGRTRRNPLVIALGIALIALGGLGAAWMATATTHTTAVIVVTHSVDAGRALRDSDLQVSQVMADSAVHTIPGSQLGGMVGKYATVRLLPGQLLTPEAVTAALTPPPGKSLVGVAVTATQMPAQVLHAGDLILVVSTPNAQDSPPTEPPASITAQILNSQPVPDTDKTILNVLVDDTQARTLAAWVATGRIGIVLVPAGQAG